MGLIRIVLALAVLIGHLEVSGVSILIPGNIAVELFFIISGYYMAMVMGSKVYENKSKTNVLAFYKSRFFRLYPTFLTVSAFTFLYFYLVWWMLGKKPINGTDEIYALTGIGLKALAFFSNVTMFGQDLFGLFHVLPTGEIKMFYARNTGMTGDGALWLGNLRIIGQAWSIGTEIWFYILVPFLSKLKVKYLIVAAVSSFLLKMFFEIELNYETYFFFPCQMYLFLIGMLAFYFNTGKKLNKNLAILLLGLVLLSFFLYPMFSNLYFRSFLYIFFFFSIDFCFKLTKSNQIDRVIGNLSYPIYLVHMLVFSFLHNLLNYFQLKWSFVFSLSSIALSIIAALLIYYLIEVPFDKFRSRYKTPLQ